MTSGRISPWPDRGSWVDYGNENSYSERNPVSLMRSEKKDERAWYSRGQHKGWLKYFTLSLLESNWPDAVTWKTYGIEQGYDKRNPNSLEKSKDGEERSWYRKGKYEGWAVDFSFSVLKELAPWKNYKEWKQWGMKNKYNKINSSNLRESEDKKERTWYRKGRREGWLSDFSFQRLRDMKSPWQTYEEWEEYGLNNGYGERSPMDLRNKRKNERSWYSKGGKNGWLRNFPFNRIKRIKIDRPDELVSLLEQYAGGVA